MDSALTSPRLPLALPKMLKQLVHALNMLSWDATLATTLLVANGAALEVTALAPL